MSCGHEETPGHPPGSAAPAAPDPFAGGDLRLALHRCARPVRRRFPTGEPDGPGQIRCRNGGRLGDRHRRVARRGAVAAGAEDRRSGSENPGGRRGAHGEDRGHAALRRGEPLHRRHVLRLGARPGAGVADGAGRAPERRRPAGHRARHVPRPEQRLPLRDQSGRRHGRRPGVRERRDEQRLERHLDRAHRAHGRRVERGVRHPVQDPELPVGRERLGLQHQPHDSTQAGGEPLDGGTLPDAVLPDLRSGRNHESRRLGAGRRPRRPPLHRAALAAPGHRRRHGRRKAGTGRVLQHHPEPQAVRHREHRLRRDGSGCAADQPHALLHILSRETHVLPAGRRRVQLRHDRHRSTRGAFPAPEPRYSRSSAGRSACSAGRRCRSTTAPS